MCMFSGREIAMRIILDLKFTLLMLSEGMVWLWNLQLKFSLDDLQTPYKPFYH